MEISGQERRKGFYNTYEQQTKAGTRKRNKEATARKLVVS